MDASKIHLDVLKTSVEDYLCRPPKPLSLSLNPSLFYHSNTPLFSSLSDVSLGKEVRNSRYRPGNPAPHDSKFLPRTQTA